MMAFAYDAAIYPIRNAALASGFALNYLRSLYQRGHFKIIGGEEAKRRGLGDMLNLHDVLNIAVAKRLMDLGVSAADAFKAGTVFAHTGEANRLPGRVFDSREASFTVLVYYSTSRTAKIYKTDDGLDFSQLFVDPITRSRSGSSVVLLNDVERDVMGSLRSISPSENRSHDEQGGRALPSVKAEYEVA